jgi:legumain
MTGLATGAIFLLFSLCGIAAAGRDTVGDVLRLPSEASRFFHNDDNSDDDSTGTRWAILLAGSNGYWNYRHQVIIYSSYIYSYIVRDYDGNFLG